MTTQSSPSQPAQRYPLIAPRPPRLSTLGDAIARVEASGIYSNNGPEVQRFEAAMTARMFGGHGDCLAVGNATLGLMLAIRAAAERAGRPKGYALMPALTFAATAHAALWAGLTPLVCDVDPDDWSACRRAEDALFAEHGDAISVVVPYATFGNAIDLRRYEMLSRRHGVGVVIDAAASLGTLDDAGVGFGAGVPFAVVYSMQATKPFAVGEGGVIHSGDAALIARLRAMSSFGFEAPRSATIHGINAKLPEVLAIIAQAKLDEIETLSESRARLEAAYRAALGPLDVQRPYGTRRALGFMSALLPAEQASRRPQIIAALADAGIGAASYFSPHLGEQSLFQREAVLTHTPIADAVASRILSLPANDAMTPADADHIARTLHDIVREGSVRSAARPRTRDIAATLVIGGGPAGSALLTAASKDGRLGDLAAAGLVVVERGDTIGAGRLGRYAINSDSTAQTFLTAIENNPHPEIAALTGHVAIESVARYQDALGVPLTTVGPFLTATGERLERVVRDNGGSVLKRHDAVSAKRGPDGVWHTRLRRLVDGHEFDMASRTLVIATGGHQPLDRLAAQRVAGESLVAQAGDRLLQSDEVLAVGGFERIADLIGTKRNPKIVVIGGSTSALTTVALLLRERPALPFGAGGITLLHRRPLRPFYHSVEAAHAEGFTDFGPDDICPVSGFVYRLAGFRLEARDLVQRMLGIDGRAPDPRVALHQVAAGDDAVARQAIADADLVVAALGYRPRAFALEDSGGARIALAADRGAAMVDSECRVLGASGAPVPGLYGIGLAAGFVPSGGLGGEKSFRGQANGLWLWQNDVGRLIVDAALASQSAVAAA